MPFSPARRCLEENATSYYPFGAKLSRSALQKYNGCKNTVNVLILGCLDLKNVLQSIVSKPDKDTSLIIHLNHSCRVSLARNVLILKVISEAEFSVQSPEDMNYLWDLWYNLQWPKYTQQRFLEDVKSLIENGLPEKHNFSLDNNQIQDMQEIFRDWLSATETRLTESSQIENILAQRAQYISNGGLGELGGMVAKAAGLNHITSSKNMTMRNVAAMITQEFPTSLKKKLHEETKLYFDTGYFSSAKRNSPFSLNPTLLEPKTCSWLVDVTSCPFNSYLPLLLDELDTSASEGIAAGYCQKKLKDLVAAYQQKKKNTTFHFHSGDDLQFCLKSTDKFDVIDSSSLADKVGLANLILSASQKLDLHPDAVLLTESMEWENVAKSVALYVEESLCAPLSMIPTIYGLVLTNPVQLGSATLVEADTIFAYPPAILFWRPAPRSENLPISASTALECCLKKLEEKCFFKEEASNQTGKEICGIKCYTPLTFSLVTTRLIHQMVKPKTALFQSHIPPRFNFAQRSLAAWANRCPVTLVTAAQPFSPLLQSMFDQNKMVFPATLLRIVLVPLNRFIDHRHQSSYLELFNWAAEIPRAHYIDNFNLVYQRNQDGSFRSVQVSFLLPHDHELEETHCGVLVDLESGTQMMFIGAVKDMQQQMCDFSHPTSKQLSASSEVIPNERAMQIVKCEESEEDFTLQIDMNADSSREFSITSDQELPCEAAHKVTFSFTQPERVEPLVVCFPFPVLTEDIMERVERSSCSIHLVLKKALSEPWPYCFNELEKWNVEEFPPWNPEARESRLTVHLVAGQMDVNSPMFSELKLTTPLEEVRELISQIFCSLSEDHLIVLADKSEPEVLQKELWRLHVHLPLRSSPSGSPVLLISALDEELADKLIANEDSEAEEICEEFSSFFCDELIKTLSVHTEEAAALLRFVLRLNSTNVIPTAWQEENLTLGKQSPVMATFLSPLYLDNPFGIDEEEEDSEDEKEQLRTFEAMLGVPTFNPDRCARCGIQSSDTLKRCSKCKLAYYCTVECQKADWKKHKIVCSLLEKNM